MVTIHLTKKAMNLNLNRVVPAAAKTSTTTVTTSTTTTTAVAPMLPVVCCPQPCNKSIWLKKHVIGETNPAATAALTTSKKILFHPCFHPEAMPVTPVLLVCQQ